MPASLWTGWQSCVGSFTGWTNKHLVSHMWAVIGPPLGLGIRCQSWKQKWWNAAPYFHHCLLSHLPVLADKNKSLLHHFVCAVTVLRTTLNISYGGSFAVINVFQSGERALFGPILFTHSVREKFFLAFSLLKVYAITIQHTCLIN